MIDHPHGKTEILAQFVVFQPEGRHAVEAAETGPYGRMVSGTRVVRLLLLVDAKFKYCASTAAQQ